MKLGNFNRGSGQQFYQTPGYPQIKIDHDTGKFYVKGNPDKILDRSLDIIGLGLFRSRTYWASPASVTRDVKIACKSHDGVEGIPGEEFPWEESEFAKVASNAKLPCAQCTFKGWLPNEKQPRCSSTWTIPALVPVFMNPSFQADPDADLGIFMLPFTASSIPNLEEYLTPLRDQGMPVYSRITRVTLKRVSKGNREFAKAEFALHEHTRERDWPKFSRMLHEVRNFMQPKNEGVGFTPLPLIAQQ